MCDVCCRELDRAYPIPVEDGWALCRGCATGWGVPVRLAGPFSDRGTCPCVPCSVVAAGMYDTHWQGLVLNAGRLAEPPASAGHAFAALQT